MDQRHRMAAPVWEHAERHLPDMVGHLMYAGVLRNRAGHTIHRYQHWITRGFVNLDDTGQAWSVSIRARGMFRARRISRAEAIRAVTRTATTGRAA